MQYCVCSTIEEFSLCHKLASVLDVERAGLWFSDAEALEGVAGIVGNRSGCCSVGDSCRLVGEVIGEEISASALTSMCFSEKFGNAGSIFITLALILFAFSTCLGWSHYGTKSWEYLLGTKSTIIYRVAFIACIMLGALMTSSLAWDISDTFNGLMALPNLIGVLACSGTVVAVVNNYKKRVFEHEDIEPMYNFDPEIQKKEMQR